MKATRLTARARILSRFLWAIAISYGILGCDVLESDPDVITPDTEITGDEVVVWANSPTFIDLNTKVKTNVPARIALSSDTQNGEITDIGKGILQYSPSVGSKKATDSFEFTVYTLNNEVIKRDTVIIRIENDSTNLPCNIYPRADYVYGVGQDSILIDVISNDIICGGPVNLSVFKPDNSFPPDFGRAEIQGNKIKYTPSPAFQGVDKIMYKLTTAADSSRYAYGVVYITRDSVCNFRLVNDRYLFTSSAIDSMMVLPVFQNDSLCQAISRYQVYLKSMPQHGQASLVANGFSYKVPASVTLPFYDHFTYEVCKDASCKTARVDITLKKDSLISCVLQARLDSINLVDNDFPVVYMNVLVNDSICGNLKSLKITKAPMYGTSVVINEQISYQQDFSQQKNDSLQYEICNNGGCSRAAVIIKRQL